MRHALARSRRLAGRSRVRPAPLGLLVFLGVTLLIAASASAAFEFTRPGWESSSQMLRRVRERLGQERVVLVAQIDWGKLKPQDGLLILHPTREIAFGDASAFLSAGGRIALLDDFGEAPTLLERFRIRRTALPSPPLESFRNNPALAIARPGFTTSEAGLPRSHPIAANVGEVVTNHATGLVADPGVELTRVLTVAARSGEPATFAAVGVIGDARACGLEQALPTEGARCGRLFAMGDPSVFIDLMLRFDGNKALLDGLVDYLVEDDSWGARGGKLIIAANDFGQSGHFGTDQDWKRSLSAALQDARDALERMRKNGLPLPIVLGLAAGLALLASAWALRTSGKPYLPYIPRYARVQPLLAQGGLAGRFAVLAAPSTQVALLLLELKTAAEHHLREHLALPSDAGRVEILDALTKSAQGAVAAARISPLLTRLAEAEKAILHGETTRFSEATAASLQRDLNEALTLMNFGAPSSISRDIVDSNPRGMA